MTPRTLFIAALAIAVVNGLIGGAVAYWTVIRVVPPIVTAVVAGTLDQVARPDAGRLEKGSGAYRP